MKRGKTSRGRVQGDDDITQGQRVAFVRHGGVGCYERTAI